MKITETCSCGASIHVEDTSRSGTAYAVGAAARDWRAKHRHEPIPQVEVQAQDELPDYDPAAVNKAIAAMFEGAAFGVTLPEPVLVMEEETT